jgi:hypothetical protein
LRFRYEGVLVPSSSKATSIVVPSAVSVTTRRPCRSSVRIVNRLERLLQRLDTRVSRGQVGHDQRLGERQDRDPVGTQVLDEVAFGRAVDRDPNRTAVEMDEDLKPES